MAKRTGIDQNSVQKIISGARVSFDGRRTDEVDATRDMNKKGSRS